MANRIHPPNSSMWRTSLRVCAWPWPEIYPGNPMRVNPGVWTDALDEALATAAEHALADLCALVLVLHLWVSFVSLMAPRSNLSNDYESNRPQFGSRWRCRVAHSYGTYGISRSFGTHTGSYRISAVFNSSNLLPELQIAGYLNTVN